MKRGLLLLLLMLLFAASPAVAREGDDGGIIADISHRNIAITTGFTGTTTTLFGALPQEGDVIVVVSGPESKVIVRRKERALGVWLNQDYATFSGVPGFYWVASSRPLADIVGADWLAANRIGTENQRFTIIDGTDFSNIQLFRDELVALRQERELYATAPADVTIMGGRLYRADVYLPADAPTGNYTVTTYLFRHGEMLDAQQTPLVLRKEGTMADLSDIAQQNSLVYALMAVALALLAGWSSAVLMRKG